ncbi:MAG: prolipoprotein diacylglyceryl transferase, partial [Candidatus Dormibacteraeota bacterium]|nr:prolipoprotein diacylglyceryl transferase [Candidatus Dormibacteraeota bacterium]
MPAVITIPLDPVLLRIGSLGIHWYGVAYVVAFAVGMRMTTGLLLRRGFTAKQCSDLYWWNIAIGLLGARLYFVIQQPNLGDYLAHPIEIVAVWKGGMAFFGALMACLATSVYFCYRHRLSLWSALDAGALFATLPQAIGRLGNIINGDILGPPSNLPWATRYTNPHTFAPALGVAYQPAGAYELLASLLLFAVVSFVLSRHLPAGSAVIVYLVGYPVTQLVLFFIRSTEPVLAFGLKQAQLTALVVLLVGIPVLVALRRRFPGAFSAG